jgi:hypothetical protein
MFHVRKIQYIGVSSAALCWLRLPSRRRRPTSPISATGVFATPAISGKDVSGCIRKEIIRETNRCHVSNELTPVQERKQMNHASVCKPSQASHATRSPFTKNLTNTLMLVAAAAAWSAPAAGTAYGQEAPAFSVVYTFNGGADGALVTPAPLSVDRAGNLHGTTGEAATCAPMDHRGIWLRSCVYGGAVRLGDHVI